jgi:membrane protein implicated in regulation of membrane protease activity
MSWWGWLIIGALLLSAEMFVIDAQFYLVFLGISAVIVGFLEPAGVELAQWQQWLAFAVLSVAAMVSFRKRLYTLVSQRTGVVEERLTLGDRIVVPTRLEPGQTCRVDYRGSSWTARNVDALALEAGREAVIANVEGLTLHVKSA